MSVRVWMWVWCGYGVEVGVGWACGLACACVCHSGVCRAAGDTALTAEVLDVLLRRLVGGDDGEGMSGRGSVHMAMCVRVGVDLGVVCGRGRAVILKCDDFLHTME